MFSLVQSHASGDISLPDTSFPIEVIDTTQSSKYVFCLRLGFPWVLLPPMSYLCLCLDKALPFCVTSLHGVIRFPTPLISLFSLSCVLISHAGRCCSLCRPIHTTPPHRQHRRSRSRGIYQLRDELFLQFLLLHVSDVMRFVFLFFPHGDPIGSKTKCLRFALTSSSSVMKVPSHSFVLNSLLCA